MKSISLLILILTVAVFMVVPSCNPHPQEASYNHFRFLELDINQMQSGYEKGEYTAVDVVKAYISRIRSIDANGPSVNSIIVVNPDALKIAEHLDEERANGKVRGPLHGIPVVLKDNIDTHDKMPTTAGSRALKNSFPLQDSFVAKKLRDAGAIILGKANLSEWANFRGQLSSSGWSGVGGQTKNPYVLSRNPCGSSSGSGVAVSANLTMLAIGTETNGSIVCPSHANGIVGLKPTVGLVSRSGVIPISFTQDSPGPMARTVTDVAYCLSALTGADLSDVKTLNSPEYIKKDYSQFLDKEGLKGKRIGIYQSPIGANYKVDSLFNQAKEDLIASGAEIVKLEHVVEHGASSHSFQVMLFEYKDGLNKYFESLGPNAPIKTLDELIAFNQKDSLELKFFNQAYLVLANEKGDLTSEAYQEALEAMRLGARINGIDKVMDAMGLDAIVAPTGSPAWKTDHINGDSFQLGSSGPAAMAGYPIITVPMGFVDELPVGISFFGRAWSEPTLLEVAFAYEQATKHRRPPEFLDEL
jgi:amidase